MTKTDIAGVLPRLLRVAHRYSGGFLRGPLATRLRLVTAGASAVVLLGFGDTAAGTVVGLVLAVALWLVEIAGALTSSAATLERHATLSMAYVFLLCVGFGALYAHHTDSGIGLEWICLGVLAISGALASWQPALLAVKPLIGANLPHDPETRSMPRIQVQGLLRLVWAAAGVVGVFAAMGVVASPWGTFGVAIVVAGVVSWGLADAWLYADRLRWRPIRGIAALKPVFMLPWGSNLVYQVTMWEQYLKELGEPYIIVTLRNSTVGRLAKTTEAPVISPADLSETEVAAIIPSSVKTAFYVQNSRNNGLFLANRGIRSVWLHHGDSDKLANRRKSHNSYDYLFVAGRAAIDRYRSSGVDIPEHKFRVIGRPQAEDISVDATPIAKKGNPTVLYAPTWIGKNEEVNYSSLSIGTKIISALIRRGAAVIFRPHPASKQSPKHRKQIAGIKELLKQDRDESGRRHVWGADAENAMGLAQVINASDAMVADVSGVVTDYMQSGKPYAMVSLHWPADQFRSQFPTSEAAYVIDRTRGSIAAALDEMLGEDPLADRRWERRTYYLGGLEGRAAVARFLEESKNLLYDR